MTGFEQAAAACGIVAILRGVTLDEVTGVDCAGFGIGSNIYKPGMSPQDAGKAARDFVAAWENLRGN